MTWEELLAQRRVAREPTSKDEIGDLFVLVQRYLADASIAALSDDGRFDRAYGGARTLAQIVIRSEGYRIKAQGGGHYNTFLALEATDPLVFTAAAAYFDQCRAKRNELSYDAADVVSETEVEELLIEVVKFEALVRTWLEGKHPNLAPIARRKRR